MATKRVQCSCTIIFNHAGDLLLGNKIKYGQWECPGGKADNTESVMTTAARELLEETGLLVPGLIYLGYYDRNPKWLVHIFTGLINDHEAEPQLVEPDKHSEWIWAGHPEEYELTKVSADMLLTLGFYEAARNAAYKEVAYEGLVTRR